jgi:uncharacterized protein (DUF305 family)
MSVSPHRRRQMMSRMVAVAALALPLVACDGGGDPVQQALRDASAERHAAAVKDGTVSGPEPTPEEAAEVSDRHWEGRPTRSDYAFRRSDRDLEARMAAASGHTPEESYAARMIALHEGAIAMAEVALAESTDPEIRRLAQTTLDTRTTELAELRAWQAGR